MAVISNLAATNSAVPDTTKASLTTLLTADCHGTIIMFGIALTTKLIA